MNIIPVNMLDKGARFFIQKFSLSNFQKLKLMELGILPKIPMQLLYKNRFGSTIIKCDGVKYAIDNSIAQNLLTSKSAS